MNTQYILKFVCATCQDKFRTQEKAVGHVLNTKHTVIVTGTIIPKE